MKDQKPILKPVLASVDPEHSLFLVDVSSLYFRAFYAIRELSNSAGLPTNALYGFATMTSKLLETFRPKHIAYCFDSREPSFRKTMFADYKANRSAMPEDLQKQMPYIEPITAAFGISRVGVPAYEADDLIGTLANLHSKSGFHIVIVSGDKDFAQLISDQVTMYDPTKEIVIDSTGVFQKWGVRPDQFVDYLALVGDDSDNIPGVRGIGPKGAAKLLAEYRTLDGIYAHLDEIQNPSMKTKLGEGRAAAHLSRDLSRILLSAPVVTDLEALSWKGPDWEKLKSLLNELEFKTLVKQWEPKWGRPSEAVTGEAVPGVSSNSSQSSSVVDSGSGVRANISKSGVPLDPLASFPSPEGWVVAPLEDVVSAVRKGMPLGIHLLPHELILWADGRVWSGSALEGRDALKSLDLSQVHFWGFDLKRIFHDVFGGSRFRVFGSQSWDHLLAAYTLKAGEQLAFSEMLKSEVGVEISEFPTGPDLVRCHVLLGRKLRERLEQLNQLEICREIEFPLIPVLFDMEDYGVLVDRSVLQEQSRGLLHDLQVLEREITELAGESFNINSTKQLAHILFEKLKLKPIRKTKTGYSTDADVLETLSSESPIASKVLEYREYAKLKSTYVDALPLLIDATSGRIHTNYNQALTTTGRLSSEDPNLQNIPIRTKRGAQVRKAFVAPPGKVLISLDYSQIELRVLAEVTSDPGLARAFRENIDIHRLTASEIFGVDPHVVTEDQRRVAKAVNFGVAYGMSAFGLAESLKVSRSEAQEIIQRYFKQFPNVKSYMHEVVESAKINGYVTTVFGRRRYMDELQSPNASVRQAGERAAINAPIQGTASELLKIAMIKIARSEMKAQMIMQVHDELVFEAEAADAPRELEMARRIMTDFKNFRTPLVVQGEISQNWKEAH